MAVGEFSLIEQCFVGKAHIKHPLTVVGNGDDASVHGLPAHQALVVSTDTAVQGVHWPHDFPLEQAADRAVCAALSDLAAMGAKASWAWVSAMAEDSQALQSMGQGIGTALDRYKVELSGGDTVHAALNSLTITVAGVLEKGTAMCRDQARVGDKLWLIGHTGFSALGLEQWQQGCRHGAYVQYFSQIEPKLAQGEQLRALGVRCCMDVSDGLMQDAGHLSRASGLAMHLELEKLPDWPCLSEQFGDKKAMQVMLSGGEDYGLLFTAPAHTQGLDGMAVCIGSCEQGEGVDATYKGQSICMETSGYNHFAA